MSEAAQITQTLSDAPSAPVAGSDTFDVQAEACVNHWPVMQEEYSAVIAETNILAAQVNQESQAAVDAAAASAADRSLAQAAATSAAASAVSAEESKDAALASATFAPGWAGSVARSWASKAADMASLRDFGAAGDGATDDSAAVSAWLSYCMSNGLAAYCPAGDYLMSSAVALTVTADLGVFCNRRAKFIGGPAISSGMIHLTAETREMYGVSWSGGEFDTSNTVFVDSALSGTGLIIQKMWKCVVSDVIFTGPATYKIEHGDTGLDIVDCRYVTVSGCHYSGHPDLGIYITGDSAETSDGDGGDIVITGCHFDWCAGGVFAKRQFQRMTVIGNTFRNCARGAGIYSTTDSDPIGGQRCIVVGNQFSHTTDSAIIAQLGSGSLISNNRIQDWGFDPADGTTPGVYSDAIRLEGSSENTISGNHISMQDWTASGNHTGVRLLKYTRDSTDYASDNNTVTGNTFIAVPTGVVEVSGETNGNTLKDNVGVSVTTIQSVQSATTVWTENNASEFALGVGSSKLSSLSSSGLDVSLAASHRLNGLEFVSFNIVIINNSGTIQHKIASHSGVGSCPYAGLINNASSSYHGTPTISSSVDFNSGVGIGNAAYQITFDVPDQDGSEAAGIFKVVSVSANTANYPIVIPTFFSAQDVNGVVRDRWGLTFQNFSGSAWNIATEIAVGKNCQIQIEGYIKA